MQYALYCRFCWFSTGSVLLVVLLCAGISAVYACHVLFVGSIGLFMQNNRQQRRF